MTRIERGVAILLLLSDGSTLTASALARRFEVAVRTIYRDIEMLSATGVPVYAERGVRGGYRLLEGFFLPPVSFKRAATDAFHAELPGASSSVESEARAVEIFLTAVLDGTRVRFTYRSPYRAGGAPAEVDAEPSGLLWDRDRWYLIGRLVGARPGAGERLWRADRVGEIAASTMRATPAPSFDVRRQLGRAWLRDAMAQWARSSPV